MISGLKSAWRTLIAALREIFDESAYVRFLERHNLPDSRASYANYLRESSSQRERRPRCC
jgi:hypothetical protein